MKTKKKQCFDCAGAGRLHISFFPREFLCWALLLLECCLEVLRRVATLTELGSSWVSFWECFGILCGILGASVFEVGFGEPKRMPKSTTSAKFSRPWVGPAEYVGPVGGEGVLKPLHGAEKELSLGGR